MIKLSDWDRLYVHTIDWALRRLDPNCLRIYSDTVESWIEALKVFYEFEQELFKLYSVKYKSGSKFKRGCTKGLELTADQLFDITHKYINKSDNITVRYFIFKWWTDLRHYVENGTPTLDCPWELYKDATKEEIEQANKNFAHYEYNHCGEIQKSDHTFNNGKVLEYRGVRFPIDDQWGDAWTKNKKGEVRSFSLDWDWWYPIDEYLDLYNY